MSAARVSVVKVFEVVWVNYGKPVVSRTVAIDEADARAQFIARVLRVEEVR